MLFGAAMLAHAGGRHAAHEQALQQSQMIQTIGKLTGGVAHDLNNLLQVIAGKLQLLGTDVANNPRAAPHRQCHGGRPARRQNGHPTARFGKRQAV